MKVVLDTNIIISGLYSKRGASYQLLRAAISGELTFENISYTSSS